jgi:hypothetical protein
VTDNERLCFKDSGSLINEFHALYYSLFVNTEKREMKYSIADFAIDKSYDQKLRNKKSSFMLESKTKLAVHTTIITTYGLKRNEYANNVQSVVTVDDLFMP